MLNAVKCEQTNSRSLTSVSVHGYKKSKFSSVIIAHIEYVTVSVPFPMDLC